VQYTFDFNMADGVRDHMASITKNIISLLENLHNEVSSSLASWESGARDEYNRAKQEWDAAAAQMPQSLGRAEQALAEISNGYLSVEHFGANRWMS
jgi:WXG100 family type VII secretion target